MKLEFHPDTLPQLRALPSEVFPAAMAALSALVGQPRPPGSQRIPASGADDWRIRIGEYRFVYEIDDLLGTIRVMHVGHRRDSYAARPQPAPSPRPAAAPPPATPPAAASAATGPPGTFSQPAAIGYAQVTGGHAQVPRPRPSPH